MAQDFTDMATVVDLDQYREVATFAEAAAAWFAANPKHYSFSSPEIMADGLALRWGIHERAVMVVKIDASFTPLIFGDIVPPSKGKPGGDP